MNQLSKIISILLFLIVFLPIINTPASAINSETGYIHSAYSDDSQYAVKSTEDNTIYFFDSGKNSVPWSHNIGRYIGSIAISPDGKYVAVGSASGLIWLFDRDGNIQWKRTFGDSVIKSIAFTPDGQHIDASNILNQAFYITMKGNLAPLQVSSAGSTTPAITPSSTPTQLPSTFQPVTIGLPSFGMNESSTLWIAAGLLLVFILWLYLTRYQKQQRRIISVGKDAITLKNFTILSLLLIVTAVIIIWIFPSQYKDLTSGLILFGMLGLIAAYYLYAVITWNAGSNLLAIMMIAIPLSLYHFSTNTISGTMNVIPFIAGVFTFYAILSAIVLFISDKIRLFLIRSVLGSNRRYYRDYPPALSYTLIGIAVVSLLLMSLGSSATLSENISSTLKSTTNYASTPQYSGENPVPASYSLTPVQTTQTHRVIIPVPVATTSLETGMTSRSYDYVMRGRTSSINLILYSGVYTRIKSEDPPYGCLRYDYDSSPCTTEEKRQYYLKFIEDPNQKKYLATLVNSIESVTPNKDDQARIAISLVRQIPYDYSRLNAGSFRMRTPYEVLYDNKGVCSEKSMLLAYLLRELGYGVGLFEFPAQNHMALGLKSPSQYTFKNTGYAFVETAAPSIPTDDQGDYVGVGKLTGAPIVISVSNGGSFDTISEEFRDAQNYNMLIHMGSVLDENSYYQWAALVQKYGIDKVLNSQR